MTASLVFDNVTAGYNRHPALHHVSVEFPTGSLTAVVGPNGAGKSTLLKTAVGLLSPMHGRVRVDGCRRRDIAYLPQLAEIDRSFPIPVFDFVAMGLWHRRGPFGGFFRDDDVAIAEAIDAVGLAGFEGRSLATLSGGQMQRVLFARLILQDAPLILLDEPFSAIDDRTTADLMALVDLWHREGRTVLAVLHDFDLVRAAFPRTLILARHLVAVGDTAETLSDVNLRRARAMNEPWDEAAPTCEEDAA
jgi:zinc/manganese transport system ATP-binding protein